jgi:hypothetical protein
MNICRHCKTNEGTICDSRKKSTNGEVLEYYTCRDCNNARARKYRETARGKEVYRNIMRRQYYRHTIKVRARAKVAYCVKKGVLVPPNTCPQCKEIKKLDAHHSDYSKPLEIKWLCRACHSMV